MKLIASLAIVVALAVAGCGTSHPHPQRELNALTEKPALCQDYSREEAELIGDADQLETYEIACE